MTPLLPSDIYPQILQFLGKDDLKSCALVNTDFQSVAQSQLFREIDFDLGRQDHWDFFRVGRGREFCSEARSLVVLSSFTSGQSMADLTDFLRTFTRLRSFSFGFTTLAPAAAHPSIWTSLTTTICANIQALCIVGVEDVPLWDILAQSPSLDQLTLDDVAISRPNTSIPAKRLPKIRTLHLENLFLQEGFSPFRSIRSIESLALHFSSRLETLISLDFVRNAKPNLTRISFGVKFYNWVVDQYRNNDRPQLNLAELPQLEVLSFSIRFPRDEGDWEAWFFWLSLQLQQSPSLSFRQIEHSLLPSAMTRKGRTNAFAYQPFVYEFNEMARDSTASVQFLIKTLWSNDEKQTQLLNKDFENTATFVKDVLSLWWKEGKLEIIRGWL
ncbi:hypothetical protein DL96DRAFT_1816713 [Flagelloscypha sp. PMI_526]|nr:hypothetical protein DL96DRAFT_1816713 [Flagelloscypha sp. PMI_526]